MQYNALWSEFSTGAKKRLGISTEFAAPAKINNLRCVVPDLYYQHSRAPAKYSDFSYTPVPVSFDDKARSARFERFSLQQTAQVVTGQIAQALNEPGARPVISDRVTYCCTRPEGSAVIKRYTSDDAKGRKGRSLYSGLHVCGNAWLCPVCSQLISEFRADEARQAIAWAEKNHYTVELHTLTVRHGVNDSMQSLVKGMAEAWRWMTSHKTFKSIRDRVGYVGAIRALEVTHGSNGWHPHYHIMFFSCSGFALDRIRLSELWAQAVAKAGLPEPSIEYGYDVRNGSEAGTYLSKFGDDSKLDGQPEKVLTSKGDIVTWDAVDELSKWHSKKGRGDQSLTPFDFLRKLRFAHITGETKDVPYYKALWQEYALATRGRSRLQWSRGLKALVGVQAIDDSEVVEHLASNAVEVLSVIPEEYWVYVYSRGEYDHRSKLLDLAELQGWGGVALFLFQRIDNRFPGELGDADCMQFFQSMQSALVDYEANTNEASTADWQKMMPVNSESVNQSSQLYFEMIQGIPSSRSISLSPLSIAS